jgi:hypothetical protein
MPPSPPVLRWCTCEECIQKHTNGTLMDARFLPAHQKYIQDEWRIGSAAPSPPAHSDNPTKCPVNLSLTDDRRNPSVSTRSDDLAGCLFALTLTDNGPNATDDANKLWNSRADFQERGPSSGVIAASPTPVSMDQVATSLGHLRISHLQSNPPDTQFPDTYPSDNRCPTPEIPPSAHPASIVSGCRLPKKDRNHHSVKALKLVSNIEVRTRWCFCLFLAAM